MFRVGQKVVCVDSKTGLGIWLESDEPVEGHVYTITRIIFEDEMIFHLAELNRSDAARKQWGPSVGYAARRFRPVVERKTDISIFTKMLTDDFVGAPV